MPSDFASLFADTAMAGLLALHGVAAVYQPLGGPARPLAVLWALEEQPAAERDVETDEELAWVGCLRDAAAGIDRPRLGETLRVEGDPPESPWTFQGAIKDVTETTWKLRFGRIRPRRYAKG